MVRDVILPDAMRQSIPPLFRKLIFLTHASVIVIVMSVVNIIGMEGDLDASCRAMLEGS